MPSYLFYFADAHNEFRLPELNSVAELCGFKIGLPDDGDPKRPCMVVELEHEEHARMLADRCILIKYVLTTIL
jgi:tRNA (guanine10-N2)-methyltransferase